MSSSYQSPIVQVFDSASNLLGGGVVSYGGNNYETAVVGYNFKNTDEDENECTITIGFNNKEFANHAGLRKGSSIGVKFGYLEEDNRSIRMILINKQYTYSSEGYTVTLTLIDEAVYKDKYIDEDVSSVFDLLRMIQEQGVEVKVFMDGKCVVNENHPNMVYNMSTRKWVKVDTQKEMMKLDNIQQVSGNDRIQNRPSGKSLWEKTLFIIDENADSRLNYPVTKEYQDNSNPEDFFNYNPYKSNVGIGTTSEIIANIIKECGLSPHVFKPPQYIRIAEEPVTAKGVTQKFIDQLQIQVKDGDVNKLKYDTESGSLTYDGDPNSKVKIYSKKLDLYASIKEFDDLRQLKDPKTRIKSKTINKEGLVIYTLEREDAYIPNFEGQDESITSEEKTDKPFKLQKEFDTFEECFLAIMYEKLILDVQNSNQVENPDVKTNQQKWGYGIMNRILQLLLYEKAFTGDVNSKTISLLKKVSNDVSNEPFKVSTDGNTVSLHNSGNSNKPRYISRVFSFEEELDYGREILEININTDNKAANIKKFNILNDDEEEKISSEVNGHQATIDVTETDEDTSYDYNEEKFKNILLEWYKQVLEAQQEAKDKNTEIIIPPVIFDMSSISVQQIQNQFRVNIIKKAEAKKKDSYENVYEQNNEGNFLLRIPAKMVLAYPGVVDILQKQVNNKIAEVEKKRNQLSIVIRGFLNMYPGQNIKLNNLDPQYNKIWTIKDVEHNLDVAGGYRTTLSCYLPLADSTVAQYTGKSLSVNSTCLSNPEFKNLTLMDQVITNYVTSGAKEVSAEHGQIIIDNIRENDENRNPIELSPLGEEVELQMDGYINYKGPGQGVDTKSFEWNYGQQNRTK